MDALKLMAVYDCMRSLGLVASKREFSRTWLGKGRTYLADYIEDDRLHAAVPSTVVDRLRARLAAVGARLPARVADEVMSVVDVIDRAMRVRQFMAR